MLTLIFYLGCILLEENSILIDCVHDNTIQSINIVIIYNYY